MTRKKKDLADLEEKIKALEKENQTLKSIIYKAPIPLFSIDQDHKITHFNQALEELTGLAKEEMVSTKGQWRSFYKQARPVMADLILDQSSDAGISKHYGPDKRSSSKENRRYAATDFYPDLGKDGKWLYFAAASIKDENGNVIGAVETLQDVTEEKWLEANNQTVMRISAALPEHPGLEELMDYISKEIKDVLKSEGAIVLLYDEIKDELFFTGASYDNLETAQRARKIRFPVDSLMAGKVVRTGESLLENDPDVLLKDYQERDEKLGYITKRLLVVPIKSDSRIIGVLCAINKKKGLFDIKDQELMNMIAGACAISIENARFSDALKHAYREVASMNRAKGKVINHLSHELKTPAGILSGSFHMLKKKVADLPGANVAATLDRIERSLNRIIDIQTEVADIMEDKTYSAQKMMISMFDACKDQLETLVVNTLHELEINLADKIQSQSDSDHTDHYLNLIEEAVCQLIDERFGPRTVRFSPTDFGLFLENMTAELTPRFESRNLQVSLEITPGLPEMDLPMEILSKMVSGLIKNAVENTPDGGQIEIRAIQKDNGILLSVKDYGVGIEADSQARIFEGFFTTQETLLYSSKEAFSFNAGGKGADLLRMRIFSNRHGYDLKMDSSRCHFLVENKDATCPGDISACPFCKNQADCLDSGGTTFTLFIPEQKKRR